MNIQTILGQFSKPTVLYMMTVVLVSILLTAFILGKLNNLRHIRRERLKRKKNFTAVKTKAPIDDPEKAAQKIGFESIDTQFTVSRRIIIPFFTLTTLLLCLIPFVDRIPGTLFSLIIGITTVILGIAARPYIENFIAGLLISYSKIVNIGDTILIHNIYGTVEDITPSHTIIKIWDWRRYILPNSKMLQSELINYSTNDRYQWAHIEFYVAYDSDISLVERIAKAVPCSSRHHGEYEEPKFWIMEMTKEGILCWLAAWANSATDAWYLKHDMRTELIRQLQQHGIQTHQYRVSPEGREAHRKQTAYTAP
ncbi:MAG: mechanosensitive ion channel family protein [Spirochaetota bacterium]